MLASPRNGLADPLQPNLGSGGTTSSDGKIGKVVTGEQEMDSVARRTEPMDGEEGDLGHVARPQRNGKDRKGKGKQREEISDEGEEAEEEVDEAAEERKIQENLAKWSKADSKRRKSMRRNTQFVTPTLPSPPQVPSASTLIRRTSTMMRRKKTRRSKGSEGGEAEEVELRNSVGSSTRKGRRKESIVVGEGNDGSTVTSPTGSQFPLADTIQPDPASPTSLPNESRTSLASNGSRFIEDLPLMVSPRSSSSTARTANNPFSSPPATPVKNNPFADIVQHTPSSTPVRNVDAAEDTDVTPKGSRPQTLVDSRTRHGESSYSVQSYRTFASNSTNPIQGSTLERVETDQEAETDDAFGLGVTERPFVPLASQVDSSITSPPLSAQPLPYDTPPMSPRDPPPRSTTVRTSYEDQVEEADRSEKNTVGLLDWLLCGCWRPRGWDSEEGRALDGWEQQRGRTNPNE